MPFHSTVQEIDKVKSKIHAEISRGGLSAAPAVYHDISDLAHFFLYLKVSLDFVFEEAFIFFTMALYFFLPVE